MGVIRDAHGVVTRTSLTAYAGTLDHSIILDFMTIREKRLDSFFTKWRHLYHVIDRRISGQQRVLDVSPQPFFPSGVQQIVPRDYKKRVAEYHALLNSMMEQ